MWKSISMRDVRRLYEFKRLPEVSCWGWNWRMILKTCLSIPMKSISWCQMCSWENVQPLGESSRPWWSTILRKRPWDEGLLPLKRSRHIIEWDMKRTQVSSMLCNWVNIQDCIYWKSRNPFSSKSSEISCHCLRIDIISNLKTSWNASRKIRSMILSELLNLTCSQGEHYHWFNLLNQSMAISKFNIINHCQQINLRTPISHYEILFSVIISHIQTISWKFSAIEVAISTWRSSRRN